MVISLSAGGEGERGTLHHEDSLNKQGGREGGREGRKKGGREERRKGGGKKEGRGKEGGREGDLLPSALARDI